MGRPASYYLLIAAAAFSAAIAFVLLYAALPEQPGTINGRSVPGQSFNWYAAGLAAGAATSAILLGAFATALRYLQDIRNHAEPERPAAGAFGGEITPEERRAIVGRGITGLGKPYG